LSRQTVADKARAIFPDLDALDRYGVEPYEAERERVPLAILKLRQQEGRANPGAQVEAAKRTIGCPGPGGVSPADANAAGLGDPPGSTPRSPAPTSSGTATGWPADPQRVRLRVPR
jgi:hypothetical protein